jgi:hypothetical protein
MPAPLSRPRSRSLRRSSASIVLFCCASMACCECMFMGVCGTAAFGCMLCGCWDGAGPGPPPGADVDDASPCVYTFWPIFSPVTYMAGSLTWRRGYARTGWLSRFGGVAVGCQLDWGAWCVCVCAHTHCWTSGVVDEDDLGVAAFVETVAPAHTPGMSFLRVWDETEFRFCDF